MAKGISSVQRSLRMFRAMGRICAIVEKWNQYAGPHGIRQDLFGIIDILALDPEQGVIGIQVCGQDWQPHVKKLTEDEAQSSHDWLSTPGTSLELHGWRKVRKRLANGKFGKARIWKPRIADLMIENDEIVCREWK